MRDYLKADLFNHRGTLPNNFTTTIPSTKQVLKAVNSFKVDTTYFGKDPKRLRTGITLCIEADGYSTYKSAVQEINVQLDRRPFAAGK